MFAKIVLYLKIAARKRTWFRDLSTNHGRSATCSGNVFWLEIIIMFYAYNFSLVNKHYCLLYIIIFNCKINFFKISLSEVPQ